MSRGVSVFGITAVAFTPTGGGVPTAQGEYADFFDQWKAAAGALP